jgi:hypothetical protein
MKLVVALAGWLLILSTSSGLAAISGPVLGFVFDPPTGSIRQINGIPGAAYLGAPVLSGLNFAAVAPNGLSAVLITADQELGVVRDLSASTVIAHVSPSVPAPSVFAWAPDSSAFAMAPVGGASVVVIRSMATVPVGETISMATTGGLPAALAISSSPNRVVAGIRKGKPDGLYLLPQGTEPVLLLPLSDPVALVFSPDGASVYAAAGGAPAQIVRVDNLSSPAPAASVVLSIEPGQDGTPGRSVRGKLSTGRVSALALGEAGTVIYIFGTSPNAVSGYSLENQGEKTFDSPLESAAWNVSAVSRSTLLLLNPARDGGEPLVFLDLGAAPKVFFVPAPTGGQ